MSETPLDNYLLTHRLRSGLEQEQVARLLGNRSGSVVSRHETGERVPELDTALAYAVVYGVSLKELFRGRYTKVEKQVKERVPELLAEIDALPKERDAVRDLQLSALADIRAGRIHWEL